MMTLNEAIEVINGFKNICYTTDGDGMTKSARDKAAIETAIEALENYEIYKKGFEYLAISICTGTRNCENKWEEANECQDCWYEFFKGQM